MPAPTQSLPARKRLVMVTGVQRSGTTAVFEALANSPGVTPRHEAADDEIYVDYFLRPEPQIRSVLNALPGAVLLKPVRETERRPLEAIADEYADYDLRVIWLYRDPVNVFASYMRLGWASESPVNLATFADRWCVRNENALAAAPTLRDRLVVASYEDLCSDPALLPKLATLAGLSASGSLRSDRRGGRQNIPASLQSGMDAMTRDVARALAEARSVRPTRKAAPRATAFLSRLIKPRARPSADRPLPTTPQASATSAHTAFIGEEYAELLQTRDPASVYRKWHASPVSQKASNAPAPIVAIGFEDSRLILTKSSPELPFPRSERFRDCRRAALEPLFAEPRLEWNQSIRELIRRHVEEQFTGRPFVLGVLLADIVHGVNATWMGYPAPLVGRICQGLIRSTDVWANRGTPNELAAAIAHMQATGLLRRLLDHGMFTPEDVPAFIHDTAVRTYLLATVVTNALLVVARHPPLLDQLREAPLRIPGFLVEAIRLGPSFVGVRRRCNESVRVAGLVRPAGATVDVIVGAANRDPSVFPDPDRCLLDRKGPPPIMLEAATAHYLRLQDDAPWPDGSLLLDTAVLTLEALIAGDRPLRIKSEPRSLLVPWPDDSCLAVPGDMVVALGD